jgi:2,3-dihydroxybenzoate-AMP ligase
MDRRNDLKPAPGAVALFLLSGGTTGLPKLIPRTHDDYVYNFSRSADLCDFGPQTRYLVVLPIAHNFPYGSPGLLGALHNGGCVIVAPSPNPLSALPLIEREQATVCAVVPAVAMRWMDEAPSIAANLDSLDLLQVGGARFAPEAASLVPKRLGCRLQQVFGMAEGLLNFTRLDEDVSLAIETQGRPMCDDDEIRIVDEAGLSVEDGDTGELLVRGPYTLRGYFRAADHNKRAFTMNGFYRSGDIVRRHPSGNLIVEGRSKDLINRGGEKISAEEIENLMLAHPAVAAVAAVAMPDSAMGERICAFVVTRPGQTIDLPELRSFMASRGIAAYKLPERLISVDALPLTPIGKIDKKTLRAGALAEPD